MAKNKNDAPAPDFIENLSNRKKHILSAVVLFILPMILYNATILGGKHYSGHDKLQWRAGAESIIEHREATGEEALWATNMFSGMPAYVISVKKAVTHIDNVLFGLGRSIRPAVEYWVMLCGLYLLFILLHMRPLSAIIGSIGIAFTTYIPIIIGVGHNTKFAAYVFIPWMFIGYLLLTRSDTLKKRLFSFFALSVALTLQFRAGHPQVTYYFFYLLLFWWIYDTVKAYRTNNMFDWSKITGWLAFSGVLGFLGNAQQFWRMLEYSPYSIRGGSALSASSGGLNLEYAFRWSQGFGELLTLIIPTIFGGSSGEAYWGPKSVTSGPHYLGAIIFILAILGVILYKNRQKYVFLGTGVLTMLFSLGYHFPLLNRLMFQYVPYFNKFRTPEMWLIVSIFCFSVLAVFGLNSLIQWVTESPQKLGAIKNKVYGVAGGTIVIGLLFTFGHQSLLSFEKPGEIDRYAQSVARQNNVSPQNPQVQQRVRQYIDNRVKPKRIEMAQSGSTRFLILALLTGALIWAYFNRKISTGYFVIGLILLTSYDMISIGKQYLNEDAMISERRNYEQAIESRKQPQDDVILNNIQHPDGYEYRVFPAGRDPFNNAIPAYFYPSIGGYTGAKLSHYQDLVENLLFTNQYQMNPEILQMLNVKFVSHRRPLRELVNAGFEQVYSGEDGYVFQNNNVLPKAFFVDSLVYASSAQEAIDEMDPTGSFDASEYAVVETSQSLTAQPDTAAAVSVTEYGPRNIKLETNRSTDGFMVLSEIYYPEGWTATIDGEETEIHKTNYVLRGIEVPAGDHTIHFNFHPRSYFTGKKIAWASNILQWLIGLLSIGFIVAERRKDSATNSAG